MNSLVIFFVYLLVALLTYGNLQFTFFQQDEWAIFANYLYWQKAGFSWIHRLFFYGGVTHLIPFANIFSYLQFKAFGLTFTPYAFTSIFLHVINAYLVTKLALELKGSKILAFLSGLFFLSNPTTSQAVTWIATTPGTVVSVTFTLLTLVFFLRGKLILSLLLLIAALGFKESSAFLFLYLPILWLVILKNDRQNSRLTIAMVALVGFLYVGTRFLFKIVGPQIPIAVQSFSQPSFPVYIYRLMTHPFKAFSQTIFPQEFIITLANEMMKLGYPWMVSGNAPDPHIAQSVASDIVSYVLSLIVLGIFFFVRKSSLLFLMLLFIAMSVIPLVVIPGSAGYISLFDGRHLYMTSVGVGIVFAILVVTTFTTLKGASNLSRFRWGLVCIVGAYFVYSIWFIRSSISKQVAVAITRKTILEKITNWYPKLSDKTIVVTESDHAFYGLPPEEHVLPFQSGFGNTLLVWYDMHGEKFPACLFIRKFLYELTSQEYKECDGRGFGYFRYPANISDTLAVHKLSGNNVIVFSYTYGDNSFIDITKQVRSQLSK